jgi:glycosyltransferase involved in cell wall biosynthesis
MVKKLVIIGPAWPLRGGLAKFDEKLAETFSDLSIETSIETFSLQYPSILFPGKTQYSVDPAPLSLKIKASINSINPFNWIRVGLKIRRQQPDLIIIRYWIPFLGPCLGTIAFIAKNKHTKTIALVDNMIPHERRIGDHWFTKYFSKAMDGFLTMSEKVSNDVRVFSKKPIQLNPHPIFDHFGAPLSKEIARQELGISVDQKMILFFGFIRKYKGLDLLIEAMAHPQIRDQQINLLIVGEFYEDEKPYLDQIEKLGLVQNIIQVNQFVPDDSVKKYVCAADFIIQPYRNATQSGVTPLAYHFEKPMLVTQVGALADTVPHGKVGVVVQPDVPSIVAGILELYATGESYYIPYLKEEKQKYSWQKMAQNFITLYQQL